MKKQKKTTDTKVQMTILDFEEKVHQLAVKHFPNSYGDGHTLTINIANSRKEQDFQLMPVQKLDTIRTKADFERAMAIMATNMLLLVQANNNLFKHFNIWQNEEEQKIQNYLLGK